MKNFILLLFVFISSFCYGQKQKKYPKPQVDTIIVKKDSVDYEIRRGSLAFFKNCEYKVDMNINGQSADCTEKNIPANVLGQWAIMGGKRGLYVHNIKMKNPDGTFKLLPSKQIIVK